MPRPSSILLPSKKFIQVRGLQKSYPSPAGHILALKDIDVEVGYGEFVAVIGKSGSGKSTFINMLTGIDKPTAGEVVIGGVPLHTLNENQMAEWRGKNLGIVFQFFQMLPTLTLLENIVMPMELNNLYTPRERRARALHLLQIVGLEEHAHKMPSAVSGGQQQRAAIARALANDPPLIIADEPTGSLDSKTAAQIFSLFKRLAADGKTILMVTHDDSLAKQVDRAILIADGEVVNEYLAQALNELNHDQLVEVKRNAQVRRYEPGATIVQQGEVGEEFFILLEGEAEISIARRDEDEIVVNRLRAGQYFGETALTGNGLRTATVRATHRAVTVAALKAESFGALIQGSPPLREKLSALVELHQARNQIAALSQLDPSTLNDLTQNIAPKTFPPGALIIRQEALGDSFFVLLEGEVEIILHMPDGRENFIKRLHPGQYFGEMALLGDGRRNSTVRVAPEAPVKLVELKGEEFERLIEGSPIFREQVQQLSSARNASLLRRRES